MAIISSEGLSEKYLHVNNCGIQILDDADYRTVRPNGRVDYHMLCIMKGHCTAVVNGEVIEAYSGDAVLYRPNERQEYSFLRKDRSESLWIHFTGRGCAEYLGTLGLLGLSHFRFGSDPALLSALGSMVTSKELGGTGGDVCDGYFFLALALMSKAVLYGDDRRKVMDGLSAVVNRINRHYAENLSADDYAAMCCMSKSRFEHIFSETVGMPLRAYVIRTKIDKAKDLLKNTSLSVRQVGEAVGIADTNYFSRVFKKNTGKTPFEYRKKRNFTAE